ncbi:MAG: hypothetical protein COA81_08285 [Alphaproteobacteria bacterium]|nr:MAG: hypothetical protein COA81_08285 [Alphaproteobacteria bacterium]
MIKYDISKAAKPSRPKGTIVILPPIHERISSVKEYRALLRRILREMAKEVRESVLPAYKADRQYKKLVGDNKWWFVALTGQVQQLQDISSVMAASSCSGVILAIKGIEKVGFLFPNINRL